MFIPLTDCNPYGDVNALRASVPGAPILVVDDCSQDETVHMAKAAGAEVLSLPHHLGLGTTQDLAEQSGLASRERWVDLPPHLLGDRVSGDLEFS